MDSFPRVQWSLKRFLKELSSSRPIPGGGSAGAVAGALGCALAAMVGKILLLRKNLSPKIRRRIQKDVLFFNDGFRKLERLMTEDSKAYDRFVRAQRKRGTPDLSKARRQATQVPLSMCQVIGRASHRIKDLSPLAGPHLQPDLKAAQALLAAGCSVASEMVKANRSREK